MTFYRIALGVSALLTLAFAASADPQGHPPTPAAVSPVPAGAVLLRYKFKAGDQHTYKLLIDERGTLMMGQRQQPMNQQLRMQYRQTVQSVDPSTGNATVVMQFQSMTMTMNGQTMPMPASATAPLNKAITTIMSPTGKLISMDLSGVSAAMPGGASSLSSMQSTSVLPDGPVKPGDTWSQTQTAPGLGVQSLVPMMLAGVDHQGGHTVARINQTYNVSINMSGKQSAGVGQTGTMTGTGVELFDTDLGLPTSVELNAQMDTHIALPAQAAAAMGGPQPPMHLLMNLHMVMSLADGAPN